MSYPGARISTDDSWPHLATGPVRRAETMEPKGTGHEP